MLPGGNTWSMVQPRHPMEAGAAVAWMSVMLFLELVTDDAADRRATHRSDGAATSQDGAANSADTGANRGIFILLRHSGTTPQAEQHGYCYRINC